jgi:hypothetical protein
MTVICHIPRSVSSLNTVVSKVLQILNSAERADNIAYEYIRRNETRQNFDFDFTVCH